MDDSESRAQSDPLEGSELDAEGEEVDEEFEQSLANGFIGPQDNTTSDNENAEDGLQEEVKHEDDGSSQNEESSASSVSEENEWQESSHSEEDAESKTFDTNRCV
jgi:histone acetyltransferase SAS3